MSGSVNTNNSIDSQYKLSNASYDAFEEQFAKLTDLDTANTTQSLSQLYEVQSYLQRSPNIQTRLRIEITDAAYFSLMDKIQTALNDKTVASLEAVQAAASGLDISAITKGATLSDVVYNDFARTGEAELNQKLQSLGDALGTLHHVSVLLSRIDKVLSINPTENYLTEDGELMLRPRTASRTVPDLTTTDTADTTTVQYDPTAGADVRIRASHDGGDTTQTDLFWKQSTFTKVHDNKSAIEVVQDAYYGLQSALTMFPAESAQYKAFEEVKNQLENFGVGNWDATNANSWAPTNPTNAYDAAAQTDNGDGYWSSNAPAAEQETFAYFFNSDEMREKVNAAIIHSQTTNDIEKQNLRQALFIYQQFINTSTEIFRIFREVNSAIQRGIASR